MNFGKKNESYEKEKCLRLFTTKVLVTGIMEVTGLRVFCEESDEWSDWFEAFKNYLVTKDIKKGTKKLASLKLHGGPEIRKLLANLKKDPKDGLKSPYREAISRLKRYFAKSYNALHEITVFQSMKQGKDETVRKYLVRLRAQAAKCRFADPEQRIHEQFVQGLGDEQARNKAILKGLTLAEVLKMATMNATLQPKHTESEVDRSQINWLGRKEASSASKPFDSEIVCHFCRKIGHPVSRCFKLRDHVCKKCGKKGHSEGRCRVNRTTGKILKRGRKPFAHFNPKRQNVNFIEEDNVEQAQGSDDSEPEYLLYIEGSKTSIIEIGGVKQVMTIDTGSNSNIIPKAVWDALKAKKFKPHSQTLNVSKKFYTFDSDEPMKVLMSFTARAVAHGKDIEAKFYVTEKGKQALLGADTAEKLGVITFNPVSNE